MKTKLTPWFSGDQKPVRKGVYQRVAGSDVHIFNYFNGSKWCVGHSRSIEGAHKNRKDVSGIQDIPWRGVMK